MASNVTNLETCFSQRVDALFSGSLISKPCHVEIVEQSPGIVLQMSLFGFFKDLDLALC